MKAKSSPLTTMTALAILAGCGSGAGLSDLESDPINAQSPTKQCVTNVFGGNAVGEIGHLAVDFRGAVGTPVYPIAPGKLVASYHIDDEMNYVDIVVIAHRFPRPFGRDETNLIYSAYHHINRNQKLQVGQVVQMDTVIAHVAQTKYAPHLHFSMFDDNWAVYKGDDNKKSRLCNASSKKNIEYCVAAGYANGVGKFNGIKYWFDQKIEKGGSIINPLFVIPGLKDCYSGKDISQ